MAKRCDCHRDVRAAMARGVDFHTASQDFGKRGYHEHRCECACDCKHDTLGYAYCPQCHFDSDCLARRGESIGILGLPFKVESEGT